MIVFDGVGKRFPGAPGPALDGIDLEVPDGSVLGLVGRNGAGKSTLLRIAAGITRPTTGRVRVDGLDLETRKSEASRSIGWVPETPRFDPEESPRALLEHLGELDGRSRPRARERAGELLDRLELAALSTRPIRTLSQGELRRLALASAWLADPGHLLYDEVTNGLDAPG
ncbi:MAG: ABC transporter ATP-binding protein, partial [Thermoplasmata archaeon]|nr:ABC transporter ATP-binding protein [Thermoplasmata archaeon]